MVGAGQAGIEAALASARLGLRTACTTMRLDRIGHLPCNCSIGGPAKGHIAREVDALGGQMGVTTDYAVTHIRRVGTGKGPAVQTARAHVCKTAYPAMMRRVLTDQPGLTLFEASVETVSSSAGRVTGVVLADGTQLSARSVVLTTGTFLNGICHEGMKKTAAARSGDLPSIGLGQFLVDLGVRMRRFKTGTTPRIARSSIDFSKTLEMSSEPEAGPFSFLHDRMFNTQELLPCWQTWTNATMHDFIKENLHQSAMYSGQIEGVGPRYCPSIEDKVVKFADKDKHPIFLEIEEWDSESVYVQGVSTSLPADVQLKMLREVPGLADVVMLKPGYAVEYDMADPLQLTNHLMSKLMPGLFLAGQLNGTSGYEEAAGQGIVAGINAAHFASDKAPIDFPRSNSFIGVMIDDLVTKGVDDPYRMLTARAEYRLVLRHDNADARLTPLSLSIGLCSDKRASRLEKKLALVEDGVEKLKAIPVSPAHTEAFEKLELNLVVNKISLFELLRRPEMNLAMAEIFASATGEKLVLSNRRDVREQLELTAKYDGYLQKQLLSIDNAKALDGMTIPLDFDYAAAPGLSYETKDKLGRVRPTTIGQAGRVPGVRPTDVALLIGYVKAGRR